MFKLVRIDTEEPNEIQIPAGTYLIGRDKLIGFDDKRLSYNQGLIIVKEDSVTIESSQRKIYLTKKGSKEKDILNKTFKTTLEFGDQFGFLQNTYWFELQSNESSQRALKEINVNTSENSPHFTKESVVPKSPLDNEKQRKRKKGESENYINGKSKRRRKDESEEEVSDEQSSQEFESNELNGSMEENSKPVSKRERCEYGGNCYSLRALRPNPAHKLHLAQYSHPRDDDWGTKTCPQGIRCENRDAKHFRNYKHPTQYIRIRKYRPGKNTSDSDSDSSQEYRSDRLLRTKRERKPPPKENLDLEESLESQEDPFASDGSEEWTPEHRPSDRFRFKS